MDIVKVSGENPYDILIENGIIKDAGKYIRNVTSAGKALIIADSNVAPLYSETVSASLEKAGFEVHTHVFPAGEVSKTLATVEDMLRAMCEAELTRSDIAVALGGGVCGDMAGFASAIYLRGIDFVQIPTTLLSQIDSSVGGKTGCDLSFGKNLAGAFHNPKAVLIDPDSLSTLPDRYLRDGMGEAIKYGCIFDKELFDRIDNEDYLSFLPELIKKCVELKRDVVEEDFRESGRRTLLNFGHTVAHAIEREENYCGLSHGEAVAVGMVMITKAAEAHGLCKAGEAEKIARLCEKSGLPTSTGISAEALASAALHDKKTSGAKLKLVLLNEIGDSYVHPINSGDFAAFLKEEQP